MKFRISCFAALLLFSNAVNAFFFIFPIPNVAKPHELQALIDALEKSEETRAVAFVSEDKTFGGKRWLWGKHVGLISQEEANQRAFEICRRGLAAAKDKAEGGQKLYDFGTKDCELHPFTPNDGPKKAEVKRKTDEAEAKRLADIEEAKRAAAEEERKKIAAEDEHKRIAADEEQKRQQLTMEEDRRRETERATAKPSAKDNAKTKQAKPATKQNQSNSTPTSVDFNSEAIKAARILGCNSPEIRVIGAEAGDILYSAVCADSKTLSLVCDKAGLCLRR